MEFKWYYWRNPAENVPEQLPVPAAAASPCSLIFKTGQIQLRDTINHIDPVWILSSVSASHLQAWIKTVFFLRVANKLWILICCRSLSHQHTTRDSFLKSLHHKLSLVSHPWVHCSTQTLKTWSCRRHAFPPELHVFLLNHTNETHSHVWKEEANSGNHDCGCLATIRPRSHSNRPISHRNRLWVIMSNQAAQRRTTKGGWGERGGWGGRGE